MLSTPTPAANGCAGGAGLLEPRPRCPLGRVTSTLIRCEDGRSDKHQRPAPTVPLRPSRRKAVDCRTSD